MWLNIHISLWGSYHYNPHFTNGGRSAGSWSNLPYVTSLVKDRHGLWTGLCSQINLVLCQKWNKTSLATSVPITVLLIKLSSLTRKLCTCAFFFSPRPAFYPLDARGSTHELPLWHSCATAKKFLCMPCHNPALSTIQQVSPHCTASAIIPLVVLMHMVNFGFGGQNCLLFYDKKEK